MAGGALLPVYRNSVSLQMSMAPKPVKDNVSTNASGDEYVRAKHNYKGVFVHPPSCVFPLLKLSAGSAVDGELSFTKGDIIKVINKVMIVLLVRLLLGLMDLFLDRTNRGGGRAN